MKGYLFIINPIAGENRIKNLEERISEKMNKAKVKFKIIWTKKPDDARNIVKYHIDEYDIFVAVGGDGTIKEVASGLAECKKGKLAILPVGTANDLAKALEMSEDLDENLNRVLNGDIGHIDVGKANGDYFLNIASVGYDSEVIVNYNKFEKKRGRINYYLSAIYTLFKYKNKRLKIKIDDKMVEENVFILAIGSGKYYGGGFKVLPQSKFDDGYYHMCIVKDISKLEVLFLFPTLITGKHIKIERYVDIYKAKSIEIESDEKMSLNLDGEILGSFNKVDLSLPGYKIPIKY